MTAKHALRTLGITALSAAFLGCSPEKEVEPFVIDFSNLDPAKVTTAILIECAPLREVQFTDESLYDLDLCRVAFGEVAEAFPANTRVFVSRTSLGAGPYLEMDCPQGQITFPENFQHDTGVCGMMAGPSR